MLTFAVFAIWLVAYLVIGFGGALTRGWSALTGTPEREAALLMQAQSEHAAERRCHCCGEPFARCRDTYRSTTAHQPYSPFECYRDADGYINPDDFAPCDAAAFYGHDDEDAGVGAAHDDRSIQLHHANRSEEAA